MEKKGNYIHSSTGHKCKQNVSEISPMNNENKAIFNCGWNRLCSTKVLNRAKLTKNRRADGDSLCKLEGKVSRFGVG